MDGSKIVTLLCVIAYMNNMQCEYIVLIYAIDVLAWVAYGCKLYVSIIIIHGMLMFHVALIYTCNTKYNALASCISYARAHRVESGVGAWYLYIHKCW